MRLQKTIAALGAILLCIAGCVPAQAQGSGGNEPILTFHTTLYDLAGTENKFTIGLGTKVESQLGVDTGYGINYFTVGQAVFDPDNQGISSTCIPCSVGPDGEVKIYGDPELIDYIDFEGCYINSISFPELTNVEILNLEHNLIENLDLSHMDRLQAIYLTDNPFNEGQLTVGGPKTDLVILEMSIINHLDPSFDMADYPALVSFEAWNCPTLTSVNPAACPELMRLSIDVTPVSSVDVSQNPKLLVLNVADTPVSSLDVSNNPYLTELYCSHGGSYSSGTGISTLDVTHNPELQRLHCGNNHLTQLDLSGCPKLLSLSCSDNLLTSLDISGNPLLQTLDVRNNFLDFATLPAPRETFIEYYYTQNPFPTDRSYAEGTVLDFSDKVLRPGTETVGYLYYVNEANPRDPMPLDPSYYTWDNGKITLNASYSDSVMVVFANSELYEYPMTTSKFLVKPASEFGKDNAVAKLRFSTTVTDIAMMVGISGATAEAPVSFSVDFGDGNPTTFTSTTSAMPQTCNVSGQRKGTGSVTIYLPEGVDMTAFGINGSRVLSADFSSSRSLSMLEITDCALPRIDLSWNRCLTHIDLSGNMLTTLDLSGANGDYGKNILNDVNASHNMIESFILADLSALLSLDLSDNMMTEIALDRAKRLETLNLARNPLAVIDLEDCEALKTLNASGCKLTSLPVASYTPLVNLDVTDNFFTIPALYPLKDIENLTYAPQHPVEIPETAPGVNLSEQILTVDGLTTGFEWIVVSDGRTLTDSEVSADNGMFRFLDSKIGKIYCRISHPLFPAFAGDKAYVTTQIQPADMPTYVFATFIPSEDAEGNLTLAAKTNGTTIYVDWNNDGELTQYILEHTYNKYPASVKAGQEVKCYSYGNDSGVTVFSVNNIPLSEIDASGLTDLIAFSVTDAGLADGKIKYPVCPGLAELTLDGNNLTELPIDKYPSLNLLSIGKNPISTLDVSSLKSLTGLYADECGLTQVHLDNPILWDLGLQSNSLTSIDLSGVPMTDQLWLSNNKLSEIDLTGLDYLNVLFIDGNRFDFTTLPAVNSSWYLYNYSNQAPLDVTVTDGKVDLSSQATVNGVSTVYTWYIGVPEYDEEGNLIGETLAEGSDYTIDNGITTFLKPQTGVMCIMTYELFPKLLLYTDLLDITESSLTEIATENIKVYADDASIIVNATAGADCAVYAIDGKVIGRTAVDNNGHARFDNLASGVYIVRVSDRSFKLLVK